MRVLVTGSSGHLGEALVRSLRDCGHDVVGLDCIPSRFTSHVGSITEPACVARCVHEAQVVLHTATLHKPHVGPHSRQAFVDTNITGTLTLLEAAVAAGVGAFVCTSTTSVPPSMRGAAGGWRRRSRASTTACGRRRSLAGCRATTFPASSPA